MELIDLGQSPTSVKPFTEFLRGVCEKYEMDYAAYAGLSPISNSIHGHVTYPDAWKQRYVRKRFHLIDPTLRLARRSIAPVDWSRLQGLDEQSVVFREAQDFGISGHGITIPVRGPFGDIGMLSFTRKCSKAEWEKLVDAHIASLQSAAVYMHDHVMSSETLSNALRFPHLSDREREVLQWVAAGKSQTDIAEILAISSRTVEVHLRSARSKLYSLTSAQAVGRAISLGLIFPM